MKVNKEISISASSCKSNVRSVKKKKKRSSKKRSKSHKKSSKKSRSKSAKRKKRNQARKPRNYLPLPRGDYVYVSFDLEMKHRAITQIAAVSESHVFSRHVINNKHSEITRIKVVGRQNGDLVVIDQCLQDFLGFLRDTTRNTGRKKCILYAHNAAVSDAPLLVDYVNRCHVMSEFSELVAGFSDTLPMFRAILPAQKSYKQTRLVESRLNIDCYHCHDAELDAIMLSELVTKEANTELLRMHSFDIGYVEQRIAVSDRKRSLMKMVEAGALKKYGASVLAEAGHDLASLKDMRTHSGDVSLEALLMKYFSSEEKVEKIVEFIREQ